MTYLVYAAIGNKFRVMGFICDGPNLEKNWAAMKADILSRGYRKPFYNKLDYGYPPCQTR